MSIEKEHLDVFQNIEFEIVRIYRLESDLIDAEVLNAIESLISTYNLEIKGRSASMPKVKGLSAMVAAAVKDICESWLGRGSNLDERAQLADETSALKTVQNIVDCLKRIQSSIKFWTKKNGRKGYLNYIESFVK
jgi:hypothetical protein